MNKNDNNFLVTMILSIGILLGWNYFFDKPQTQAPAPTQNQSTISDELSLKPVVQTELPRAQALKTSQRIPIQTPKLSGSLRLTGGRLDDLILQNYHTTTDSPSPQVVLLSPESSKDSYYIDMGWLCSQPNIKTPADNTLWTTTDKVLSIGKPVTLIWDNGDGLVFKRIISVDEDYMFTVENSVVNQSQTKVELQHFVLSRRHGLPQTSNYVALHEGIVGYIEDQLQEIKYKDLQEKGKYEFNTQKGWFGFTDKYWLTAIAPAQQKSNQIHFRHMQNQDEQKFQVDALSLSQNLEPQGTLSEKVYIFSGPKELHLLDAYEKNLNIEHLDLAVDFGWFYFITKPLFYFLSYMQKVLGNLGLAILALTVILKLLFFPLANKSYKSMARMKQLQPMIESLKGRFGDDKLRFNQEMMALYKREKVNPASGCIPMIVQIPFFFALYKVLFVSIEMRHAPFWGWVHDLSAPDPTTVFNLFGLIHWMPPSFLMIGAWPLIMGVTMFAQQKLNPAPADPMQAKMFMIMPVMFTYMLAQFPVGLVIYWAWNNILTILQQWFIMKQATQTKPGSSKRA